MSFLAILEVLNFRQFEQLSSPKFTKIQISESLKLSRMTFLECLKNTVVFNQDLIFSSKYERLWMPSVLLDQYDLQTHKNNMLQIGFRLQKHTFASPINTCTMYSKQYNQQIPTYYPVFKIHITNMYQFISECFFRNFSIVLA